MKRYIFTLIYVLVASTAWADVPIASAQWTGSGMIHVVMSDGREFDVPDEMGNRHRRMVQQWVDNGGGRIQSTEPMPEPTRQEKIRNDPAYPSTQEFMEAFIDCRFNSDCTTAQALRNRLNDLRAKYP